MQKKTLVLGASENPERYSFLAVNKLIGRGHPVIAIGKKTGNIAGIEIQTTPPDLKDIDTVTLYLNANNQRLYYDYILALNPKRIIFNPGAENQELVTLAEARHITCVNACTLVLLSTDQF